MRPSLPNSRNRPCGNRCRAMLAPLMTMPGARSPPMASRAMATFLATDEFSLRRRGVASRRSGFGYLTAVIVSASRTDMMRPLVLTAIGALDPRRGLERMMGAPHVATGLGDLFLGNCHLLVFR